MEIDPRNTLRDTGDEKMTQMLLTDYNIIGNHNLIFLRIQELTVDAACVPSCLGSNSTRSVSYHHFGWAFPSSAKSRVDEGRTIAVKTRFSDFPHRGEPNRHPWDPIPRGRFHTTILSGIFQAAQKAGLTKVVQWRSKRVFSTFSIVAKRKNTIGIEFHKVRFIPPFWVGFSKQRKKLG